jgi:hypothetical protein
VDVFVVIWVGRSVVVLGAVSGPVSETSDSRACSGAFPDCGWDNDSVVTKTKISFSLSVCFGHMTVLKAPPPPAKYLSKNYFIS